MDEIFESLNGCYRKDTYRVYDINRKEIVECSEYFLVAGDHCIIKVIDVDYAIVFANIFKAQVYRTKLNLEEDSSYDVINSIFDHYMVYDYLLTKLKEMTPEEAKRSHLKDLKTLVETAIDTGSFDIKNFKTFLGEEDYQRAKERCKYLAYAYDLEWRGIINLDTCKKFDNIEELSAFVEKNDLENNPIGENKNKDILALNYIDYQNYDILHNVRENGDMLSYYTTHGLTLKDEKRLKMADIKTANNLLKAFKYTGIVEECDRRMFYATTEKQVEKLKNKEIKYIEKAKDITAQDVFLVLGPECNL